MDSKTEQQVLSWNFCLPPVYNNIEVPKTLTTMLTEVIKVKDTQVDIYGCCDNCGGCRCNN